ncbi:MAG: 30S ribosomal protein S12 methylthiotransferase RimO [Oscillospiraceae bacterium]|nr:30S ribosomal protein S12 methylthiotransferase RimO [Oscillospiraceae bacterium]
MPIIKRKAKVQKIAFVSLGCPKNQVNAERMMHDLQAAGFAIAESVYHGADVVIVNTCGFVDDAKKEAIDSILEMAQMKADGTVGKILVTGCMAQRYQDDITAEIPEVDGVLGLGANDDIVEHVQNLLGGATVNESPDISCLQLGGERKLLSPQHWAYLQIADGCSNCCTYCAIPGIRGPFRHREMEDILAEAEALVQRGARELVLIAQDVTAYPALPSLLTQLCQLEQLQWLRLLYCYPDEISDELIAVMASENKIVKYIDLPLQHADDRMLAAMGRRGTQADITAVLDKLRTAMPDVAIRTTFICGFPGEDDAAFENLAEFVAAQKFTHMGAFVFSPQEGTPAATFPNQIDPEIAQQRVDILTQQQAEIALQHKENLAGQTVQAMVEAHDPYTDGYLARTAADAPEIDGILMFTCPRHLQPGDVTAVKIIGIKEDMLIGKVL